MVFGNFKKHFKKVESTFENPRKSYYYEDWRKAVLEKDDHTCQMCGAKEKLQAHHIVPFSTDESKRYDLFNGVTLCKDCHGEHHYGSKEDFVDLNKEFNKELKDFGE